ncbi:MAG: CHASE sensor domain-containing protein, partial [Gemmatimonadaceae bacterium]
MCAGLAGRCAQVAFGEYAAETLAALQARPHLVAACIYRRDGTMLAGYSRPGAPSGCPAAGTRNGVQFTSTALTVSYPILLSGHPIGTLVLLYDLDEIYQRMKLYGVTVLGVLLASILIAFLLSSRLRAIIAAPISQLARAATSVSRTRDYSIRARKNSRDELGVLVDAFNQM